MAGALVAADADPPPTTPMKSSMAPEITTAIAVANQRRKEPARPKRVMISPSGTKHPLG
jgi:hypothetical protein